MGRIVASLWFAALGLNCSAQQTSQSDVPPDQVRLYFSNWLMPFGYNPKTGQSRMVVPLANLLPSGSFKIDFMPMEKAESRDWIFLGRESLMEFHDEYCWCHILAKGMEPVLLTGKTDDVISRIENGKFKQAKMTTPDCGIVTGIAYHTRSRGMMYRPARPFRGFEPSTVVAFQPEKGKIILCGVDAQGFYRRELKPGKYKVTFTWKDGDTDQRRPDRTIEIQPGETTVCDMVVTRMLVD